MSSLVILSFQVLTLIFSASSGATLYALWRKSGDRRARDAFRFFTVFFAILAASLVKNWLAVLAIKVPLGQEFSFAAHPESFAWFFPVIVILSPISPVLMPLVTLPLTESLVDSPVPRPLVRLLWAYCAAATLCGIALTIVYSSAEYRHALMPGLELALSVVNTALTVPVYAALGAFGVYGFSKRRRIADRAAKSGFDAFLRVIAILLPLSLFERLLSIFGSYSPLSRLYFRLFPTGWGFEWILFLVVSLICQVKAGAALFRPDGRSASVAGGRAVARLVLRERFAQAGLSVRESEIAELALDGIANKVLASRLGISHATVKNHLTNAYRKLGVSSRWELLALLDAKGGSDSIG